MKRSVLDQRRRDFYDLRVSGKTLRETVVIIGKKYKTKHTTLYEDWRHRHEWGDYVVPEEDDRFVVADIIERVNQMISNLIELAERPRTPLIEKRRIYVDVAKLELRKLEALQSLGKVYTEPVRIAIEDEITRLTRAIDAVEQGVSPEIREKIEEVFLIYARNGSDN